MRLLYKKNNNIRKPLMDEKTTTLLIRDLEIARMEEQLAFNRSSKKTAAQIVNLMSDDAEDLKFRQDIFRNLLDNDSLYNELSSVYIKLSGIGEIADEKIQVTNKAISNYHKMITWLALFCESITDLKDFFKKYNGSITADGLKQIEDEIIQILNDSSFETIRKNINGIKQSSHKFDSLLLGVNLNEYLEPVSASCLEINSYKYHPRKVIDLKKNDGKEKGIGKFKYMPKGAGNGNYMIFNEGGAQVSSVSTNRLQRMVSCEIDVDYIFSVDMIFNTLNFNSRTTIKNFIMSKMKSIMETVDDLGFILGGVRMARILREKGMPVCIPKTLEAEDRRLEIEGLYNCHLPFMIENPSENIVCNDLSLLKNKSFAVLNGPNKGGKTTMIQAVALSIILHQLGFFVPAKSACMSLYSNILTHYQREETTDRTGRFVMEAESIKYIFKKAGKNSFVILNEPYVSTSPAEGIHLIQYVLKGIRKLGCTGLLVSHYHKLNDRIEEENKNHDQKIKFYTMGIEDKSGGGRRTFRLSEGRGAVTSFAMDILKEYAPELLD